MNKILKGLLVTALMVSAVRADDDNKTDKTVMTPRAQGTDIPMAFTTFHELVGAVKTENDKFGASFAVTPFYEASTGGDDIAEYFLVNNKHEITLGGATAVTNKTADININYLLHNGSALYTADNKLALDPKYENYGARIDYFQDLGKILKGLYLYANTAIVHSDVDAELKITGDNKALLESFFNGDVVNATYQSQLAKSKIHPDDYTNVSSTHHDHEGETGLADIEIGLGYKFLNKEKYAASLALGFNIPTGESKDADYLLAPTIGNTEHFGLGADLCAMARVWSKDESNLKLHLKLKYRYLFENSEFRTFNFQNAAKTLGGLSHYYLLAQKEANTSNAAKVLIPAANVTTLKCDVDLGSQFEGVLALSYANGGFNCELGYNMFFREDESVELKDTIAKDTYVVAAPGTDYAGTTPVVFPTSDFITNDSLVVSSAETPSIFTNGIFGGLGYVFKEWKYPLMLGLGAKYDWAANNSMYDQYAVYGKIGIGF